MVIKDEVPTKLGCVDNVIKNRKRWVQEDFQVANSYQGQKVPSLVESKVPSRFSNSLYES